MRIDWIPRFQANVPKGFKRIFLDRRCVVMVREEWEPYLCQRDFPNEPDAARQGALPFGRGKLDRLCFNDGQTALVRTYRHGGLLRYVTEYLFFSWPPRPFLELAVSEEARQRGVQTVEVLGARVERAGGPFYRGWLITRELKGADHFWDALRNDRYKTGDRFPLLQSVAECIREMHRLGLLHADLNLKNILVRRETHAIKSYVIDLDKARLFPREVPAGKARQNLRRLLRSARKLDPSRHHLSIEEWEQFVRFYAEAGHR